MSISDYTELMIEAADRTGDTTVPSRGKMLVGMAEAYLNKKLRVSDMEGSSTVTTDASGSVTMPSGWIEIKGVYRDKVRVPRLTYSPVEGSFTASGYYTDGDTLKSNLNAREIVILYFEAIPSLHDNGTNWLLSAEPEIYLTAIAWQVALRSSDFQTAGAAKAYLDGLLAEFSKHDATKRHGLTEINMTGESFVRGSDFTVTV